MVGVMDLVSALGGTVEEQTQAVQLCDTWEELVF